MKLTELLYNLIFKTNKNIIPKYKSSIVIPECMARNIERNNGSCAFKSMLQVYFVDHQFCVSSQQIQYYHENIVHEWNVNRTLQLVSEAY